MTRAARLSRDRQRDSELDTGFNQCWRQHAESMTQMTVMYERTANLAMEQLETASG